MKSGKCPKCGGQDVRFQKGMSKRSSLKLAAFTEVALCDYICGDCGYLESYVEAHDLQTVRTKVPVARWKGKADD